MKHVYLWTALAIAALVAVIVLWRMGSPHYPKIVIALPGNVSMTVIEQPWSSQEKCVRENEIISSKVRGKCANCRITASCPTQLDATETRALRGQAIGFPVVYTTAESTIIDADAKTAMSICNSMAEQITKQKIQHARCIAPANTR